MVQNIPSDDSIQGMQSFLADTEAQERGARREDARQKAAQSIVKNFDTLPDKERVFFSNPEVACAIVQNVDAYSADAKQCIFDCIRNPDAYKAAYGTDKVEEVKQALRRNREAA